jgi:hypothetical protein
MGPTNSRSSLDRYRGHHGASHDTWSRRPPERWIALPEVSGTTFQWGLRGAFDIRFLDIMIALLFVDFFDTLWERWWGLEFKGGSLMIRVASLETTGRCQRMLPPR